MRPFKFPTVTTFQSHSKSADPGLGYEGRMWWANLFCPQEQCGCTSNGWLTDHFLKPSSNFDSLCEACKGKQLEIFLLVLDYWSLDGIMQIFAVTKRQETDIKSFTAKISSRLLVTYVEATSTLRKVCCSLTDIH